MRIGQLRREQQGLGLLEVLIAIIVLAVGILALIALQTNLLRNSSGAKARTVAASLAKEEIEEMRSMDYADVLDYATGSPGCSKSISRENVTFAVGCDDVEEYWFMGTGVAAQSRTAIEDGGGTVPTRSADFLEIPVAVTWSNETGDSENIQVKGIISQVDPVTGGIVTSDASSPPPEVNYKQGNAPEIIRLNIYGFDDSSNPKIFKEATKPEPEIIKQSGTVTTKFDEVVYNDTNGGSYDDNKTFRRDETLTVNCVCQLGRSDSQKGLAPTVFDPLEESDRFFLPGAWVVGEPVNSKTVGRAAAENVNVGGETLNLGKQPGVCDICCRDHHDDSSTSDKYDPFRSSSEYSGGDHKHYFPNSSGDLIAASNNDDLYLEACRMNRVDGIWRTAQDWHLVELQNLPSESLDPDNLNNILTDYQDYVTALVQGYIDALGNDYPTTEPDANGLASTERATLPTSQTMDLVIDNVRQLLARGIYIDYMKPELVTAFKCKLTDSGCDTVTDEQKAILDQFGVLALAPFHEINVTGLSSWAWDKGGILDVTSEPIDDSYSRGLVTTLADGEETVTATNERGNTGLTDTREIYPAIPVDSDALDFDVGTNPDPTVVLIAGDINISNNAGTGVNPSDISVSGINNNTGSAISCVKPTDTRFKCALNESGAGTSFTITFSGYNYLTIKKCSGVDTTIVYDNRLNTSGTVTNSRKLAEATAVVFADIEASQVSDVTIQKDSGAGCSNTP